MTLDDLHDEICIDFEVLDQTVAELIALQAGLARQNLTVREKVAAAAFLAQLYTAAENILKAQHAQAG